MVGEMVVMKNISLIVASNWGPADSLSWTHFELICSQNGSGFGLSQKPSPIYMMLVLISLLNLHPSTHLGELPRLRQPHMYMYLI